MRAHRPADPGGANFQLMRANSPRLRPRRSAAISAGSARRSCPRSWRALVIQMPVGAVSDPVAIRAAIRCRARRHSARSWSPIRATPAQPDADIDRACPRHRPGAGRAGPRSSPGDASRWAAAAAPRATAARLKARAHLQRSGAGARAVRPAPADAARPQCRPGDARPSARPSGSACWCCAAATIRSRRAPRISTGSGTTSTREAVESARAQRYLRDLRRDAVIDYR